MPKVGNKEFPYTKAGMKAAKKAAKDTDQEVQYKMGGGYMMRNKPIAMKDGGSCRGMGAASKGGKFRMA